MDKFKIKKRGEGDFIVIPTAEYLEIVFDKDSSPYDTNWEIYRRYSYTPEQMLQYLIAKFNASISLKQKYPYVNISFDSYVDAENFKKELDARSIIQ